MKTFSKTLTQWHDGYAAWEAGKARDANPYWLPSDKAYAWDEGWETARVEHTMPRQTASGVSS